MRLREVNAGSIEERQEQLIAFIEMLRGSPIAVHTSEANEQHYEVPAQFFELVLGKRLKYSSAYWGQAKTLDAAEEEMLDLTCKRAELLDGQDILELGCGWGSLTLYVAEKFPNSRITAVSNSNGQRQFIEARAAERGLANIRIITADMNSFSSDQRFDRVVSVEMFEHMRNYHLLFQKIYDLLKPGGKLFVHIFVHARYPYLFEVKDDTDWMAKYFFTGGTMPSADLLLYFKEPMTIEKHWAVNGMHYAKTARAWLENADLNKDRVMDVLRAGYGSKAAQWFEYWRIFFMACEELFAWNRGEEWLVNHYRFGKGK
ncbi:MAG: cyclopropane-fatty-acyl-phospholipid synthase family protein [Spirochaetia bacterium]|nr:cyclopropane-fatty-acyl-phospholipid synthase family protein [Spirochaetia bacterium]